MTVQTNPDRRFRRAHVSPSHRRRAEMIRRLVDGTIAVALLMFCVFVMPDVFRSAAFLRVDTITVEGNVRVSEGEVLALVGQLRGQNILVADLEIYRDRLLMSGWIESATLRRVLPSSVVVSLVEREPAGLARFGARLYLIDGAGTLIEEYGPRFADVDLPIVDGLAAGADVTIDRRRAELASRLIGSLSSDASLAARVSQISVADPYDVVVLLSDGPTLIHLGDERFSERLRRYVDLAPTLRAYVPEIDYVDMRFEKRIVVRGTEPIGEAGSTLAGGTHIVSTQ